MYVASLVCILLTAVLLHHRPPPNSALQMQWLMKQKQLNFCLAHEDWTIGDWKNDIFTDETSVSLNQHHRGVGIRVWHS